MRINISIDSETDINLEYLSSVTQTNKSKLIRIAIARLTKEIKNEMHSYVAMLED